MSMVSSAGAKGGQDDLSLKCPSCGGELVTKQTEKLLRGGNNLGTVTMQAYVCMRCGERLYTPDAIRLFEDTRTKLSNQETE